MRSIGKRNINFIKNLVRKEKSDPNWSRADIEENVMSAIPDEMFDLWEGAYTEIQRIIIDAIMEQ